jgi:hypothetical protein
MQDRELRTCRAGLPVEMTPLEAISQIIKKVLVLLTIKYFMGRWILQTSNGKSLRPSYHQIAFVPIGAVVHGVIGELH